MSASSIDLVVSSLEPWDAHWRRNQFLVAGLLRSNPHLRVLFVEPPEDPAYLMRLGMPPTIGKGMRMLTEVAGIGRDRLWGLQPTKWLPRAVHRSTDQRLARITMRAARSLGFVHPVLWINNPTSATLMTRSGWPTVYDMTDDWLLATRGIRESGLIASAERTLMSGADEVTVCSTGLQRSKGDIRPVTLIPNAVDLARYRLGHPRPIDLPTGKVALYVGTVHPDRVDADLSIRAAEQLSQTRTGTLVFVGSFQMGTGTRIRIQEAGGVILGTRPNSDVPAYLQHADVLVVPHIVSPFTDSLDPIKLYEYLAVGRPIVSTPVAGFRDDDDPRRIVIANIDEFPSVLVAVIGSADASRGPAYIADDVADWSVRVAAMESVISTLAESRRPPH